MWRSRMTWSAKVEEWKGAGISGHEGSCWPLLRNLFFLPECEVIEGFPLFLLFTLFLLLSLSPPPFSFSSGCFFFKLKKPVFYFEGFPYVSYWLPYDICHIPCNLFLILFIFYKLIVDLETWFMFIFKFFLAITS